MRKFIKWIKSLFIKPKPKFPLSLTIYSLRNILEETIDLYCGVHLGKPKQYWVKFCEDIPYKFSFLVFDSHGHAIAEYTIIEMIDNIMQTPSLCYDRIAGKLHSIEIKRDYD